MLKCPTFIWEITPKGRFLAEGTAEAVFSDASVIRGSHLRLPRIAHLMKILHKENELPVRNPYPLTIRAARTEIVRLMRRGDE
jgi:cobalt/nickel transport system ATP-binding protein